MFAVYRKDKEIILNNIGNDIECFYYSLGVVTTIKNTFRGFLLYSLDVFA